MINKTFESMRQAVADIPDGATVMIGGFGNAGMPSALIDALIDQGARELTIVNNNAGNGETGLAALLKARRVRKIICSFPRQADSHHFDALYRAGEIELELTPPVPASAASSRPRVTARNWPKARKPASSMAATTCWNRRSTPTSR
jgi:3-oxoadipate CoA-transferase alpha subunit